MGCKKLSYYEGEALGKLRFFYGGALEKKGIAEKKGCNVSRFGFNGQEKDNEIMGIGNSNTALFWQYDTRLGRRWNIDPIDQISISNYAAFANSPIYYSDLLGNKPDKKGGKDDHKSKSEKERAKKRKETNNTRYGTVEKSKETKKSYVGGIDVGRTERALGLSSTVTYSGSGPYGYMDNTLYPMCRNLLNWTLWFRGSEAVVGTGLGKLSTITAASLPKILPTIQKYGITESASVFASNSVKRDHAMRHLIDAGIIGGTPSSLTARMGWTILNKQVLTNPGLVFNYNIRGVGSTRAYLGLINDRMVVLFVAKNPHGKVKAGQTIMAIELNAASLKTNRALVEKMYAEFNRQYGFLHLFK